jgi:aldehyde dehydrogenase (NAD+)
MYEYLKPRAWSGRKARAKASPLPAGSGDSAGFGVPPIDRTAKLFVGGKQVRPDGNYSRAVLSPKGRHLGEAGEGNRKDIRNAVAAARSAEAWARATAHNRAQILYYLAENLAARSDEFARRIAGMTGVSSTKARAEVDASIERLFSYGAWADKFEGAIHAPPLRGVALAMHEPIGVVGVACPDEAPLLAFISLVAPLIAMGNRVVAVPSERHPLAATDFYQVLETSDVPGGVVNIVTGDRDGLVKVLAEHDDVDALWVFGSQDASAAAERLSIGNLKRTLVDHGLMLDWYDKTACEGPILLRHAVQVKNIWIPYGD